MANKKLAGLLILLAVVTLVIGCAAKEKPTPTETPAKEEIVIGVTDKVTDLDPANAYDFYTWEVLNNIMGV